MLYAAKCYWPGVTETDLEQVAARAAPSRYRVERQRRRVPRLAAVLRRRPRALPVRGAIPRRGQASRASDAGIPCERLMDSMWLKPDCQTVKGAKQ